MYTVAVQFAAIWNTELKLDTRNAATEAWWLSWLDSNQTNCQWAYMFHSRVSSHF